MKSSRQWKSVVVSLCVFFAANVAHSQVTFFIPPIYSGAANFVGDFNGDGKPDMLSSGGTLLLGKGDGTFTTGTPVTGGAVAVGDFNGDGKIDVLQQSTGTLLVLLGNGDGTFKAPVSTNSGASLYALTAGDVNGDGKADVLGLDYTSGFNVVVYLSQGDGTFATGVSYALGSTSAFLITLGDFNEDGEIDVAVAAPSNAGQEVVLLGNGDGTFQAGKISTGGVSSALDAVAGDFNSDGKLDLAISGSYPPVVSLLLGNGDGTFQAATTVAETASAQGGVDLAVADLNGDGKLDLVLAAGPYADGLISVFLGNGDGTFSAGQSYFPVLETDETVAIADFNSDGKPDIADSRTILLGNGDGTFQGWLAVPIPSGATTSGDFDKNGTMDVAGVTTNSSQNPSVYILTNDGTGVLTLAHSYALPGPYGGIAAADLNNDGNLDLVTANLSAYAVLLGNGDGTFQAPIISGVPGGTSNPSSIVIADFNGDHKLDLALATNQQTVAVLLGDGDGTFGTPSYLFDGDGGVIASADFNGDGKPDIVEAGPSGIAILLGNGDGTFQAASFPITTSFANALFAADLNGDGKADIVAENTLQSTQVLLGNGDGTFAAPSQLSQSVNALADLNGDGVLDVVGVHSTSLGGLSRQWRWHVRSVHHSGLRHGTGSDRNCDSGRGSKWGRQAGRD